VKGPSPFVKWAGGKAQLLSQFEPYFPTHLRCYVEPFVGGGAVFFHLYRLGRLRGREVLLIDSLEELINCYRVVRDQVEALVAELGRHEAGKTDRDYYYQVRGWDRQPGYAQRSDVERAARFVFLNRTCFNGLYRVNRRGEFNVPFGRYRNPTICDAANLRAANYALQGVRLLAADFTRCLEEAQAGAFVYLDPPYHPLSETASFTSYTADDFGVEDQQRLAGVFGQLDRRGCQLMLSNSCTPFIEALYDGYEQVQVRASRPISARADRRGAIPELLVLNRYLRLGSLFASPLPPDGRRE
jgi:DNA adenine methylase